MCSTATATNKRDESRQRCSTGALGHNHHQNLPVFWSGGDDDDKDDGGGGALKRSEEYNNSKKFAANFEMQKKVDRSVCICVHLCVNQAVHSHKLSASRLEQLMITNRKCVCASLDVCRCRLELAICRRQQTHYQCGCRWAKSTYAHLLLGG